MKEPELEQGMWYHPHWFSFIFSFKMEYSVLRTHVLSFVFYSSALIFL
jgi:hypothetical protein